MRFSVQIWSWLNFACLKNNFQNSRAIDYRLTVLKWSDICKIKGINCQIELVFPKVWEEIRNWYIAKKFQKSRRLPTKVIENAKILSIHNEYCCQSAYTEAFCVSNCYTSEWRNFTAYFICSAYGIKHLLIKNNLCDGSIALQPKRT